MGRISSFFVAFGLLATPILSQNLIASAPDCGKHCKTFHDAYIGCVPAGGAPQSDMSTYVSCFCNSALLVTLKTDPASVCTESCSSASEQQGLMTWYNKYCAAGGNLGGGSNSAPVPSGTAGGVPSGTGVPTVAPTGYGTDQPGSWWDNHSKWIAMVIVLIIGFAIIIGVSLYFKRRHELKRNRSNSLPDNTAWGPNSSQIQMTTRSGGFQDPSMEKMEKGPAANIREAADGAATKLKKFVGR